MAEKSQTEGGAFFDMNEPATFMQYGGLTEMQAYKGEANKKYGGEFVLEPDHPDLPKMKALAIKLAREEWGESVDLNTIEWPFKSGNKLSEKRVAKGKAGDLYAGKVIMRPRSKFPIELVWVENGKVIKTTGDTDFAKAQAGQKFYLGVKALGSLKFQAMTLEGAEQDRKLVVCYLNKVFSTQSGDRIGGRSAEDAFKGYIGRAKSEDPTRGKVADDDIPF